MLKIRQCVGFVLSEKAQAKILAAAGKILVPAGEVYEVSVHGAEDGFVVRLHTQRDWLEFNRGIVPTPEGLECVKDLIEPEWGYQGGPKGYIGTRKEVKEKIDQILEEKRRHLKYAVEEIRGLRKLAAKFGEEEQE